MLVMLEVLGNQGVVVWVLEFGFLGEIRMISPSKIVSGGKWINLRVGSWSWKSVLNSILELILNRSLKIVLTSLKIPHEINLLKRCIYLTF